MIRAAATLGESESRDEGAGPVLLSLFATEKKQKRGSRGSIGPTHLFSPAFPLSQG
jgi:hypothetical protein